MAYSVRVGDEAVLLPDAKVIGISAVGRNEREHGESTVRFLLSGDAAMGDEPFNTLTEWYVNDESLTLDLGESGVRRCGIRECSLDIWNRELYVQLYLNHPAQHVRSWFESDTGDGATG